MSKIAVVFWSGTGNTEAMADAVVEGIEAAGAECSKFIEWQSWDLYNAVVKHWLKTCVCFSCAIFWTALTISSLPP